MGRYDHFECFGHFYQIVKGDKLIALCRSQLDIIDSKRMKRHDLSTFAADALAIMMNPGKSKPMDNTYIESHIELSTFNIAEKDLVPSIADETQKRIMKVMQQRKWKHVSIINLTDIRQHKSSKLSDELKKFNHDSANHEHSLFSEIRRKELLSIMNKYKDKPIIVAWGTKNCLRPYAKTCIKLLENKNYYGVSTDAKDYFHHPLTRQVSWVKSLLNLLESKI